MSEEVRYVQENPKTIVEESDWNLKWIAFAFLGTFIFLVISPFILMAAFPRTLPDQSKQLLIEPAPPRLQINTAADLIRLETIEDKRLRTYYWVDKKQGVVHIPIEAAMKKLARTGIPGFPKAPQ